uniref:Neuropeptide-Like Protein n=1 Tax=Steinernema glaseri TaxID=37863 RepID=A0A1I8A089_9BILA
MSSSPAHVCVIVVVLVALLGTASSRYEYTKYVSDPMKMMMQKPSPYGYGGPQLRSYKDQIGLLKRRWSGHNGYIPNRSPYDMFGSSLGNSAYQRRMSSMSVPYYNFFVGY